MISEAKKAIDALTYNESKSLDQNKTAVDAIVSEIESALVAKRAEEKAAAEKDAADTAAVNKVKEMIEDLPEAEDVKTSDKDAIEAAREAYKNLTDDQKAKVEESTLQKLIDDEAALEAEAQLNADKAAFEQYKADAVTTVDNLVQENDSDACKQLIETARAAMEALSFDESKILDENKAAVDEIINQLKTDLDIQRATDQAAADMAAFDQYKKEQKKEADQLVQDGDSDACKQ